ncbi:MAG: SgcJ/EcaC family oxidoreductase [Thermoanaerobaculia bacterium]|nr:SgcJ/EcaC family oxidoreductase [Thermoanaerobaculia bacterium]
MAKSPPTDVDRQIEELRRMRRQWVHVVNAGDVDRYTKMLTRDAVWIPPGRPALEGRKAIRAWLEPLFAQYRYKFQLKGSRVQVAGDWAVERGMFDTELERKAGGDPQQHTGTYIVLWRQSESGRWRIERYIDDSGRL